MADALSEPTSAIRPSRVNVPESNLFLLEDLEDVSRTSELAKSDLDALRDVADWIEMFVVRPHKDLGRAGPICPFVPRSLERKTLWLAPEQIADRRVPHLVQLIKGYQRRFLEAEPTHGDDTAHKSFLVVFTDLSAGRAKEFFDGVVQHLAVPSYVEDGFVMGGFYEGNEGTAIYNPKLSAIHLARAIFVDETSGH